MLADPVTGGPVRTTWRYLEDGTKVSCSFHMALACFLQLPSFEHALTLLVTLALSIFTVCTGLQTGANHEGKVCIWVRGASARNPEAAEDAQGVARWDNSYDLLKTLWRSTFFNLKVECDLSAEHWQTSFVFGRAEGHKCWTR